MTAAAATKLRIACPACLTANRVDGERRGDGPKCGHCGAPLLDGRPVELGQAALVPITRADAIRTALRIVTFMTMSPLFVGQVSPFRRLRL